MSDLGTLRPGAGNTTGLPTGSNLVIAGPGGSTALSDDSDSTYDAQTTNSTGTYEYGRELGNTPADFGTMDTLLVQYRGAWSTAVSNSSWTGTAIRVMASDGTTVLAADDSAGTFQAIGSTPGTSTTFTTRPATAVAFNYVNTSANKTAWDGAIVQYQVTRSRSKGGDSGANILVSELYITGTYTAGAASQEVDPTLLTSSAAPVAPSSIDITPEVDAPLISSAASLLAPEVQLPGDTPYDDAIVALTPFVHWLLDGSGITLPAVENTAYDFDAVQGTIDAFNQVGPITADLPNHAVSMVTGGLKSQGNPVFNTFDDYTIIFWYNHDGAASATQARIWMATGGALKPVIYFNLGGTDDLIQCREGSSYNVIHATNPSDDEWHMLAYAHDLTGATSHLYIDGQDVGTIDNAPQAMTSGGGDFFFGSGNSTDYFQGLMARPAVFDSILSQAQIQALFAAATGGAEVDPALISNPFSVAIPSQVTQETDPGLITSSAAPVAPSQFTQEIDPSLISSPASAVEPVVTAGGVSVIPPLISSPADVVEPTVNAGGVEVDPTLISTTPAPVAPSQVAQQLEPGLVGSTAAPVAPTVEQGLAGNLQLVVADKTTPTTGDAAVKTELEALGYTVTYVSDEDTADTTGIDGVVIAESVASGTVGNKYLNETIPVIFMEPGIYASMLVATGQATQGGQDSVDIVADPISHGYSNGTLQVYSSTFDLIDLGGVCSGATAFATIVGNSTQIVGFIVPQGGALTSGNAAGKRGYIGYRDTVWGGSYLNSDGLALFDALMAWAVPISISNEILPETLGMTAAPLEPAVQYDQEIDPALITNSADVLEPAVNAGGSTVTPALISMPAAPVAPVQVAQQVQPDLLSNPFAPLSTVTGPRPDTILVDAQALEPSVQVPQTVSPDLLSISPAPVEPAINPDQSILPLALLSNPFAPVEPIFIGEVLTQLLTPEVRPAQIVSPSLIDSPADVVEPAISAGGSLVTAPLISSPASVVEPQVVPSGVEVDPGLISSSAAPLTPQVQQASAGQTISPTVISNPASLLAPTQLPLALSPALLASTASVVAFTQASLAVVVPLASNPFSALEWHTSGPITLTIPDVLGSPFGPNSISVVRAGVHPYPFPAPLYAGRMTEEFLEAAVNGGQIITRLYLLDDSNQKVEEITGEDGYVFDGTVVMDRTRPGPRRTANFSISNEDGLWTPSSFLDKLWMMKRFSIETGFNLPSGRIETWPLGVFLIDVPEMTLTVDDSTLRVQAQDRWKIGAKARFRKPWYAPIGQRVADAIYELASLAGYGIDTDLYSLDDDGQVVLLELAADVGDVIADKMLTLAKTYGLDLFMDRSSILTLAPVAVLSGDIPSFALAGDVQYALTPGEDSVLEQITKRLSDERLYNAAMVEGSSPNRPSIVVEARDLNPDSPAYNPIPGTDDDWPDGGPIGDRLYPPLRSARVVDEYQARQVAAMLLLENTFVEADYSLTIAPLAFLEPYDLVTVEEPVTDTSENLLIDTVQIPLSEHGSQALSSKQLRSLGDALSVPVVKR